MGTAAMRATVYLDPELHKALRLKVLETSQSLSKLVNAAINAYYDAKWPPNMIQTGRGI